MESCGIRPESAQNPIEIQLEFLTDMLADRAISPTSASLRMIDKWLVHVISSSTTCGRERQRLVSFCANRTCACRGALVKEGTREIMILIWWIARSLETSIVNPRVAPS